jgi:hypothetical protein
MPRETQWSAAVMLDPAAAEEEATSRVWLWEQALEATGGDYSKINYRKSNWAPTLPLGPHNAGVVQAGGPHGTTSIEYDITAHNTDLLRLR